MNELLVAVLFALPWLVMPFLLAHRFRGAPNLESVPGVPPTGATPRVSIVLPARNEAMHIADCIASIRASNWPNLQLVVVNDHSTDDTLALARQAAGDDARIRVINTPDLPPGWFGKQWACENGARHATGELLLFTDADTRHAPDLVTRMVAIRAQRKAELLSVAGAQEMRTIWEQAVQPSVFVLILARYGALSAMERQKNPRSVIANGQCFMLSRAVYIDVGRHEAVRAYVAEDLMMAQAVCKRGYRVALALGLRQLSTRMYDGLMPLMKGWGKNIYAGGRHAMPGGIVGQWLFPFLLLTFPLGVLMPFVLLAATMVSAMTHTATHAVTITHYWSALASLAILLTYAAANRLNGAPMIRALLAPLGGLILLIICVQAIARRDRVEWKEREYTSH